MIYRLGTITQNLYGIDYVPPAMNPEDLKGVKFEEWLQMLEYLETYSEYDTIILDLDELVDGLFEILRLCSRIYMPVREDGISLAKLEQYEKVLAMRGYEDVREKTKKLKLPFHSSFGQRENYVEQLVWGELGDYVRRLIREEEADGNQGKPEGKNAGRTAAAIGRSGDVEDEEIFREIDSLILEEAARDYLTLAGKRQLRRELFNEIRRLDLLQELVDDDSVTEIMVNGTDGIFLERDGHIVRWEKQIDSREKLEDLVQQIARKVQSNCE